LLLVWLAGDRSAGGLLADCTPPKSASADLGTLEMPISGKPESGAQSRKVLPLVFICNTHVKGRNRKLKTL
jgi:hypothetical protein